MHVDTSAMWLADRRDRLIVTLAGPFGNLVLGGACGLLASLAHGQLQAVLGLAALANWFSVLVNLNPLLEFDGYYALVDLLDRPQLRREAWRRLLRELPAAADRRSLLAAHRLELLFGLASLAYVAGLIGVTWWSYQAFVRGWLLALVPPPAADAGLAAILLLMLVASLAAIARDVRWHSAGSGILRGEAARLDHGRER